MKKFRSTVLFILCLGIFVTLRLASSHKEKKPFEQPVEKPHLPPPITISACHPWLFLQPSVQGAALEIVRDFERIRRLCEQLPQFTEQELTAMLMQNLIAIQAALPFQFPSTLYNVLCIQNSEGSIPAPYRIVKRLYLGERELGLPFYLDVRVYDISQVEHESIIEWHLRSLDGDEELIAEVDGQKYLICRGKVARQEGHKGHGFPYEQERALFLAFSPRQEHLFVCTAEAPLSIFVQYEELFKNLAGQL